MLSGEDARRVDGLPEPATVGPAEAVLLPARMKNPSVRTLAKCEFRKVTFLVNPRAAT